jgi:hypothetical protein
MSKRGSDGTFIGPGSLRFLFAVLNSARKVRVVGREGVYASRDRASPFRGAARRSNEAARALQRRLGAAGRPMR